MSNYSFVLSPQGTWSSSVQYTISNVVGAAAIGIQYVSCPMVQYLGIAYYASGSTQPTLGMTPNIDSAWSILSGDANTLDYAYIGGFASSGVSVGALPLNYSSTYTYVTSGMTINAASVSVPTNQTFLVNAYFNSISSAASSASFLIGGTNVTIKGNIPQAIIANQNLYINTSAYVISGSTSPSIGISVGASTGTVTVGGSGSFFTITPL